MLSLKLPVEKFFRGNVGNLINVAIYNVNKYTHYIYQIFKIYALQIFDNSKNCEDFNKTILMQISISEIIKLISKIFKQSNESDDESENNVESENNIENENNVENEKYYNNN